MKEFRFDVVVTEVNDATLVIEAENYKEAVRMVRDREFDWNGDIKYHDCISSEITIHGVNGDEAICQQQ